MAHPLELSYNWRTPAVIATLGAIGCLGVLVRGQAGGWIVAALVVLVLWALFVLVLVRRARSYLMVGDDGALVLRHRRALVPVDGDRVRAVRQVVTARTPAYRLLVELPDGRTERYLVPTAWLRDGHVTLFSWLRTYAPHAELDKGSQRMLELLRNRGLIADAP